MLKKLTILVLLLALANLSSFAQTEKIDQDPLEYGDFTWHTNLDTYERISEEDAKQAAIVVASAVYHLAMREEKLPRFTKDKMPLLNYFPTAKK